MPISFYLHRYLVFSRDGRAGGGPSYKLDPTPNEPLVFFQLGRVTWVRSTLAVHMY